MKKQEAWLLLIRTPGLGPVRLNRMMQDLDHPREAFGRNDYPAQWRLPAATVAFLKSPEPHRIDADLEWLQQPDNHLVVHDDLLYPPLLNEIPQPPPALFVHGRAETLVQPQIAIIGSRNATPGALRTTRDFAAELARSGLTVTSGMALGIDGVAHEAALSAGGNTIAVTGTGLDVVYPAAHRQLAHRIARQGALVSEFPLGTGAAASHFPRRNRIIAGLSLGTLVCEAGLKSGSLITARLTMEMNRPVMAVPGSINNPQARGCHQLIKQGARLVESVEEVTEELQAMSQRLATDLRQRLNSAKSSPSAENNPEIRQKAPSTLDSQSGLAYSSASPDQRLILELTGFDPTPIDEIISKSGLTAQEVSSILLLLELEGSVQSLPGAHYARL